MTNKQVNGKREIAKLQLQESIEKTNMTDDNYVSLEWKGRQVQ